MILAAIFWASTSTASLYDHTYYVAQNTSMCTNATNPCQEFGKYLINASIYFQSRTKFIFLPGEHLFNIESVLEVHNKWNILLVGSDIFTQHSVAENVNEYGFDSYNDDYNITYLQSTTIILCTNPSGLSFTNVTNVTFANLTLLNCGQYSSLTSQTATIHISNVYSLLIEGVSVVNSTGYGLFGANIFGQSRITSSSFLGNNQFLKHLLHPITISNCKNEIGHLYIYNGSFNNTNFTGGNVYIYYDDSLGLTSQDKLHISFLLVALGMDAFFSHSNAVPGTGLALEMDQELYNMTIIIDNLVAYRNQGVEGANIYINIANSISYMLLTNINSSYATSVYSGVWYSLTAPGYVATSWLFSCRDSTFQCNFAYSIFGMSVFINQNLISSNPYPDLHNASVIENCLFMDNGNDGSSMYIHVASYAETINTFYVKGCTFKNTVIYVSEYQSTIVNSIFLKSTIHFYDGAMYLDGNNTFLQTTMIANSAIVSVGGNNTFSSNLVFHNGGAISLLNNTKLLFTSNSITTFINNTGRYGGAIYIDPGSMMEFDSPISVSFINNTGILKGGAIYIEPQFLINECFYTLSCSYLEGIHLYFEGNYANDAGSLLYGGNIDTCSINVPCIYNSTFVFDAITVIGYHDPSTSLISSDSPCVSSCNMSTNSACLNYQNVSVYPGQVPELTFVTNGQRNGIVPTTTYVYSPISYKIMSIIKTLKYCSSYTIPYEFNNGTLELFTKTQLLSGNSLLVRITVLPCPVLFMQENSSSPCICDPVLKRHNLVCNIDDKTVQNTGNIWIGLTSHGVQAFYSPCPFDYCTKNQTINALDLDSQCSYSRHGVLCGKCQGNLSMRFGTSRCGRCSNYFLFLVFVFIIMGVILVMVVFTSNFTVSNGALNGIVLYVNLIRINDSIYFQNSGVYSYILSTLIAWLNLDLGIEVCFYDGMNSYAKTWLQFIFPLYVFSLVGVVIIAGRYSSWVSKLNAVPVLSTLVLLSYSKILRTIITIFSYAFLDTMDSSSTDSLVWLYDGNVEYLGREHLPLFICGLLITFMFIIPYCILLLLAPYTQARSHWRCLKWINKLKLFFDIYQAPFKDHYRLWPGILLFIRLPLYLVFILSDSTPVKMLSIISCSFVYLCCMIGFSVYKKWSDVLVESIFISNVAVLSAVVIASSNAMSPISGQTNEAIIATGITGAMLLLAAIIIHHRIGKIRLIRLHVQSSRQEYTGGSEKNTLLQTVSNDNEQSLVYECRESFLEVNVTNQ